LPHISLVLRASVEYNARLRFTLPLALGKVAALPERVPKLAAVCG
jgi:hypothetical protein